MSKSGSSVEKVADDLNEEMENAVTWFENHMSVNIGKTNAFFVSSAKIQSSIQENLPDIKIGTTKLEVSSKEKLLEVTIDNTLNWSSQVDATIKKCNSLLFLLGRIKIYLDIPTRILYFNSYILPHLD